MYRKAIWKMAGGECKLCMRSIPQFCRWAWEIPPWTLQKTTTTPTIFSFLVNSIPTIPKLVSPFPELRGDGAGTFHHFTCSLLEVHFLSPPQYPVPPRKEP